MKTQHTPGPWKIESDTFETLNVHTDSNDICTVWAQGDLTEEGEANAALIAAAPELLEALEAMLATFEPSNDLPVIRQARTAIAKARGEL